MVKDLKFRADLYRDKAGDTKAFVSPEGFINYWTVEDVSNNFEKFFTMQLTGALIRVIKNNGPYVNEVGNTEPFKKCLDNAFKFCVENVGHQNEVGVPKIQE